MRPNLRGSDLILGDGGARPGIEIVAHPHEVGAWVCVGRESVRVMKVHNLFYAQSIPVSSKTYIATLNCGSFVAYDVIRAC